MDDVDFLVRKLAGLRIFEDETGKMNRNVTDAEGAILVVSQFTLAAETTSGNRPSFTSALQPEPARELVDELVLRLAGRGIRVAAGVFGAAMDVALVNDGPVTIILDTKRKK
jgi:D-tyrosyl-tRNA(Tyr) deacylase